MSGIFKAAVLAAAVIFNGAAFAAGRVIPVYTPPPQSPPPRTGMQPVSVIGFSGTPVQTNQTVPDSTTNTTVPDAAADIEPITKQSTGPVTMPWLTQLILSKAPSGAIEQALNTGADPNEQDSYGWSPLMYAINGTAEPKTVKALIKAGADVNYGFGSATPLSMAVCLAKNAELTALLMKAGADPQRRSKYETTPLMDAIICGASTGVISALLDGKSDPNAHDDLGYSVLGIAVSTNTPPQTLQLLIKRGAKVNYNPPSGDVPLFYAAITGNTAAMKVLLKNGAKTEVITSKSFYLLDEVIMACPSPEAVKLLIKHGAAVNHRGDALITPLMYAAKKCSNPAMIDTLVRAGAEVNAVDANGRTALMYAANFNTNPDVAAALVRNCAYTKLKTDTWQNAEAFANANPVFTGTEALKELHDITSGSGYAPHCKTAE